MKAHKLIAFEEGKTPLIEKCTQKQIKKLCQVYSKETGAAFKSYYDTKFLEWLEETNPTQKNVEDTSVLVQMCGLSFDGRKKEQVNWQVVGSLYTCFVQTTNLPFPFRRSFSTRPSPHTLCGHSHPGSATSSG